MCRRTLLPGVALSAFGLGLLLGAVLGGGILCVLLGAVCLTAGCMICRLR